MQMGVIEVVGLMLLRSKLLLVSPAPNTLKQQEKQAAYSHESFGGFIYHLGNVYFLCGNPYELEATQSDKVEKTFKN